LQNPGSVHLALKMKQSFFWSKFSNNKFSSKVVSWIVIGIWLDCQSILKCGFDMLITYLWWIWIGLIKKSDWTKALTQCLTVSQIIFMCPYFWNWLWQCAAKMINLSLTIVDPQLMAESFVEYEKNSRLSSSSAGLIAVFFSSWGDRFFLLGGAFWFAKSFFALPSPQTENGTSFTYISFVASLFVFRIS